MNHMNGISCAQKTHVASGFYIDQWRYGIFPLSQSILLGHAGLFGKDLLNNSKNCELSKIPRII